MIVEKEEITEQYPEYLTYPLYMINYGEEFELDYGKYNNCERVKKIKKKYIKLMKNRPDVSCPLNHCMTFNQRNYRVEIFDAKMEVRVDFNSLKPEYRKNFISESDKFSKLYDVLPGTCITLAEHNQYYHFLYIKINKHKINDQLIAVPRDEEIIFNPSCSTFRMVDGNRLVKVYNSKLIYWEIKDKTELNYRISSRLKI